MENTGIGLMTTPSSMHPHDPLTMLSWNPGFESVIREVFQNIICALRRLPMQTQQRVGIAGNMKPKRTSATKRPPDGAQPGRIKGDVLINHNLDGLREFHHLQQTTGPGWTIVSEGAASGAELMFGRCCEPDLSRRGRHH